MLNISFKCQLFLCDTDDYRIYGHLKPISVFQCANNCAILYAIKSQDFSQWIEIRLHPHQYGQSGSSFTFVASKTICGYIWMVISVLFAIFLMKFVRQCQDCKRLIALLCIAVPKQSHFLKVSLFKELLGYLLSQAELFADILLHHRTPSPHIEMFWSSNATTRLTLQCR